ncbi:hypothetical protein MMC20_003917 [Loxospora ochrophaea]|nr:hypothetical protein [Loxospora ochrophaea]
MAKPYASSLSAQNTGSSTPSSLSSAPTQTWTVTSGKSSYPASLASSERNTVDDRFTQSTQSHRSTSAPKLAKIRSSPSHGALEAARKTSSHGKLHKRGSSGSSITSPHTTVFPTFEPQYSPDRTIPATAVVHGNSHQPSSLSSSKSKSKRRPFLRRLASQENTSIDLSRSAAENEGLGIFASSDTNARGGPDLANNTGGQRGYHGRTSSANSQISTNMSASHPRPSAQYMNALRPAPRAYTPPLGQSYQNSQASSEVQSPVDGQSHSRGHNANHDNTPLPYAPLPSLSRTPPPLHIRTGSASRLTSPSQSNLPGTPSSLRHPATTSYTPDTMPPTARSSFDSAFRKRSRTNTGNDPALQAATVQALRAEFDAREAAKDLRYQQAESRAREKEAKKREKRDESTRRKSEAMDRKRAKSNAASEKSVPLSTSEITSVPPLSSGTDINTNRPGLQRSRTATAGSATKAMSSQWSLFWFKFKTMLLKLKRKIGGH